MKKSYTKRTGPKGRRNAYAMKGTLSRVTGVPYPARAIASANKFRYSHTRLVFQDAWRLDVTTFYNAPRYPVAAQRWAGLAGSFDAFKVNAMRLRIVFPQMYIGGTFVDSGLVNPVLIVDRPTSCVTAYDNDQLTGPSNLGQAFSYDNAQLVQATGLQSYEVGLQSLKAQMDAVGGGLGNFIESEWVDVASGNGMQGVLFAHTDRLLTYSNGINNVPDALRAAIVFVEWDVSFRQRI